MQATTPVRLADSLLFFKSLAREVAQAHGFHLTFMPKPFWGINGSGAHIHLSFYRDGANIFESTGGLTEKGMNCVAGILSAAREISAIVAPTVNSYKRLVPGHEAPTRIAWGYANRSTLIRVPVYRGHVNRIEYRHPDPMKTPISRSAQFYSQF